MRTPSLATPSSSGQGGAVHGLRQSHPPRSWLAGSSAADLNPIPASFVSDTAARLVSRRPIDIFLELSIFFSKTRHAFSISSSESSQVGRGCCGGWKLMLGEDAGLSENGSAYTLLGQSIFFTLMAHENTETQLA